MIVKGVPVAHGVLCRCSLNCEDVPGWGPEIVETIGKSSVEGIVAGVTRVRADVAVDEGPDLCEVGAAHVPVALPRHLLRADQEHQEEKGKSAFLFLHMKLL